MNTKEQLIEMVNDMAEKSADEVLENALNIEYIMRTTSGEFLGALITMTTGGPHIEINTNDGVVKGYWGGNRWVRIYQDNDTLNFMLEDLYGNC